MKIAIITNYWKNSEGGGIKTYVVNLADALKNKKIDVNVIFRFGEDPDNFKICDNKLLFVLKTYYYLIKIRPDFVQTQAGWYGLLAGVLYKRLHSCTLIHTFHTEPVKRLPIFAKIFFQGLLNNCDCVTFVSKKLKEQTEDIEQLSFQETAISYPGVTVRSASEDDIEQFRERFGIQKDATILLSQGMTANVKKAEGLIILIRAVRILRDIYPNIILIVTRKGIYSDTIQKIACEMDMEKQIILTGDLENPFIPLKICDIYTHITLADGLPLALLEAMAVGKPIIATPIGGIPEAVNNGFNGFLVEPDPERIAEKIDYMIQNSHICDNFSRNARFTVEKNFSLDSFAMEFISLYRK